MKKIAAVLAVAAAFGVSACANVPQGGYGTSDGPRFATSIVDGTATSPPPGFVSLCMRAADVCANTGQAAQKVALNAQTRARLIEVNNYVNESITYKSDREQYGVANFWNPNALGGYGDCKDYALAKRQALLADGLPESALRIAVVRTAGDELHAVLTVDTDKGDYVLDSLTPEIRTWTATNYTWLSRQSSDDPLRWVNLASAQ